MKSARRRQRSFDPSATPAGVRTILQKLREQAPTLVPNDERQLISLLNAVRYAERGLPSATNRGRPRDWQAEDLHQVATQLRAILARETQGRVSLQTFIGQHLRLLAYPAEIAAALQTGQLNKQEALALARLTAEKLQTTEAEAQRIRNELLHSHLAMRGSQNQLRERVKALLGEQALVSPETLALGILKSDALLELKPTDVRHVFFETIKELFYAIRKFDSADLIAEDLEEFMEAADALSNTIHGIELRIRQRQAHRADRRNFLPEPQAESLQIVKDPVTGQISYKFN